MHLGQLANCFNDFNEDRAVLQVQNNSIVSVLWAQTQAKDTRPGILKCAEASKTAPIQDTSTHGEHYKTLG